MSQPATDPTTSWDDDLYRPSSSTWDETQRIEAVVPAPAEPEPEAAAGPDQPGPETDEPGPGTDEPGPETGEDEFMDEEYLSSTPVRRSRLTTLLWVLLLLACGFVLGVEAAGLLTSTRR